MSTDRARLYRTALLVLVAGSSAGCGTVGLTSAHPSPRPGSVARPRVQFAAGEWTATGTILEAQVADASSGEKIVRPWDFRKTCQRDSCGTVFLRQTLYGWEETPLVRTPRGYLAVFPPSSAPCPHYPGEDAGTSQDHATFTLEWSANRQEVIATEHERYVGNACGGMETVSWVAKPTNPDSPPASGP